MRSDAERATDRIAGELRSQKFKTMAERSARVRLKKRIACGVCPCCKRTFTNLARHISGQHPEYGKAVS